jgi:hypothetical protein
LMDSMISTNSKSGSHSSMHFCVMPCTMAADHGAEGSSWCTVCCCMRPSRSGTLTSLSAQEVMLLRHTGLTFGAPQSFRMISSTSEARPLAAEAPRNMPPAPAALAMICRLDIPPVVIVIHWDDPEPCQLALTHPQLVVSLGRQAGHCQAAAHQGEEQWLAAQV